VCEHLKPSLLPMRREGCDIASKGSGAKAPVSLSPAQAGRWILSDLPIDLREGLACLPPPGSRFSRILDWIATAFLATAFVMRFKYLSPLSCPCGEKGVTLHPRVQVPKHLCPPPLLRRGDGSFLTYPWICEKAWHIYHPQEAGFLTSPGLGRE